MKRLLTIFSISIIFLHNICIGQFRKEIENLANHANQVTSDSEKVIALGRLADLYYAFELNRQADSVLNKQFLIADVSNNNNLILIALFDNAVNDLSSVSSSEVYDRTIEFVKKGISYAKSLNKYEYIAMGYTRMANLLRKRGRHDEALTNANLALGYLHNIKSDSIKAVIYIELGNTYQARNESVLASASYNTAFDIAFKIKSIPLQSQVYHCFSEMYTQLGNKEIAKEELKKSLALNKQHNNGPGMVKDYYDLARITDEKFFIEKMIELATSLNLTKYVLKGKKLMFYYYMVAEKNSDKALAYLKSEPDVNEQIMNVGQLHYMRTIGQVFLYGNKADSALHHFKMAEDIYLNTFGEKLSRGLFREIAQSYKMLDQIPSAIKYYMRVLDISKGMNDASDIAKTSDSLSYLYETQGDYTLAFMYSKQSKQYQDSLNKLSEGRDIALLNVERENRKHAEEVREAEQKIQNKKNIQYIAITIAIGIIFILLLIIGMFPVSKLTIRFLSFMSFISLFEFIVLVIDNFLHGITHGEPLKIWLIKIVLIAMLVPLQHGMEHKLTKFLESRKLLEARTKFNFRKWLQKKPALIKETDFEEGTAVL